MNFYSAVFSVGLCLLASALSAQDSHDVEASRERGKLTYEVNCLACHQADGSGVPNLAPPLIKGTFVMGEKARLIDVLLNGLEGVEIKGEYYSNPMPPFGYMTDQEIADVLTYIRSNFSNAASAVTAAEVGETRKKK